MGTSSVRALVFDGRARQIQGVGAQLSYRVTTTPDGGVEISADELFDMTVECLTQLHSELNKTSRKPLSVAFCAFWHSFLGVGDGQRPTTPIIHLFDTRSARAAESLGSLVDARQAHARVGTVFHTSYWPAKLLWLSECRRPEFDATRQWLSFGEYLFLRLFGEPATSTSMVSASGLWNQNRNDYDDEILRVLPIDRAQLAAPGAMDQPRHRLLPPWRDQWPLFDGIPWFPALGDGAANNVGSGCVSRDHFALMVGTSGAMRAIVEAPSIEIPEGLWCYRVDRRRFVLGGALSNGGEVFAWMRRTLALPADDELERSMAGAQPGAHGLTVVPLFAGERSPNWRSGARAAIAGMSLHTTAIDIARAALESVALRFRQIYEIMEARLGVPRQVTASGGALLHSPAWTQIMADALGRPVVACVETEASSRGAALVALERLGVIASLADAPAATGDEFAPLEQHAEVYRRLYSQMKHLYGKLFEQP